MKLLSASYLSAVLMCFEFVVPLRAESPRPPTLGNPLDLAYRFELKSSYRAAADPTAIYFHGEYWLFASKCGGYWHSPDFLNWTLVEPKGLNVEGWAPSVEVINDRLYFITKGSGVYTTDDPAKGNWKLVSKGFDAGHDGALFLDDDGRLYFYTGCSSRTPILGHELDVTNDFSPIGSTNNLIFSDPKHRGWEANRKTEPVNPPVRATYIEGAWMNKFKGRYYLQYGAPGTQCDTYGDGVFVSDHPLGPFKYEPYSPFSLKPTGFAHGAGHGSTFKDAKGNYWHIATIALSIRHPYERRLGLYPVRFFPDGQMACNTYLGDYPQYAPGAVNNPFESNSPGWMLLSLNKPVKVSSELTNHCASMAVDENLHDWWSAATGNPKEWIQVDLDHICRIEALQLNFADEGATQRNRLRNDAYGYLVEVSDDAIQWKTLLDRKENRRDAPHDYAQLDVPVMGRYVRVTNLHTPGGACFSMSGLRIFGNALGSAPEVVKQVTVQRNSKDARAVHISWPAVKGADFYIVRYGVKPDRLYSNYQVYDASSVDIDLLNSDVTYYATVDAINGSGITKGPKPVVIPTP